MKIKTIVAILLVAFILASCASATRVVPTETAVSTLTFTPVPPASTQTPLPSATAFNGSYPPCGLAYGSSFSGSAPVSQLDLSNGLTLKEYRGGHDIKMQESGCGYAFRDRVHITEITLNNSFHIVTKPIEDSKEEVVVLSNGEKVYETQISRYIYSGLLEAWGYGNHWVIEFVTTDSDVVRNGIRPKSIDIVRDGVSLKKENNYKDVFAFQLLAGKPFYFFRKHDNTFGVNYDGRESELDYDDIPYDNPAPGLDRSIFQYQNMIEFLAKKGDAWHYLVIGTFNK